MELFVLETLLRRRDADRCYFDLLTADRTHRFRANSHRALTF